jgi:molybdopterin molybdotransferase
MVERRLQNDCFVTDRDYLATEGVLRVAGRAAAGHPLAEALSPGSAARIFTGAVMPAGADSVAMQEDCELISRDGADVVSIPMGLKPGANRRKAGEDLPAGGLVVAAGSRLRPQEVAAIASTGAASLEVFSRLRVAIVSTGDEIVRPGAPLGPGQVYDSNHYLLAALLGTLDVAATDAGILPDSPEIVRGTLADLAASHDAILTTGGASRGEEDHLVASLGELGSRHIWQLAIKPGRPMSFGQIGGAAVFALPGNPVAAFVCFLLYVRPFLAAMGGAGWIEPPRFLVPARFEIAAKKPDRREFLRGRLVGVGADMGVEKFERDGSGLITSLREADGLIEIAEPVRSVRRGENVSFLPFSELGLRN